jgi:hypothetical protein
MSLLMNNINAIVCAAAFHHSKSNSPTKRQNPTRRYSIRNNTWKDVLSDPRYHFGWFERFLRCSFQKFTVIVQRITEGWLKTNAKIPHHNAVFKIVDRVACTLYFLGHADGCDCSGAPFGMRYFKNN